MVLQNYVILQPGVPARLHFLSHQVVVKTIADPVTGRDKRVQSLQFEVDELNGKAVVSAYSTISQKHAQDFAVFLSGERYRDYDFLITMTGEGFRREYQVQPIPRSPR